MELQAIKSKLGRWLNIEELQEYLTEVPGKTLKEIPVNRKLLEIASEFVEKQKGWWEHPDWESFLSQLSQEGYNLTDETKASIGNILEIFKQYYHSDGFQAIIEKRRKPNAEKKSNPSPPKAKAEKKRAKKKSAAVG